jgi:hypothetical protein
LPLGQPFGIALQPAPQLFYEIPPFCGGQLQDTLAEVFTSHVASLRHPTLRTWEPSNPRRSGIARTAGLVTTERQGSGRGHRGWRWSSEGSQHARPAGTPGEPRSVPRRGPRRPVSQPSRAGGRDAPGRTRTAGTPAPTTTPLPRSERQLPVPGGLRPQRSELTHLMRYRRLRELTGRSSGGRPISRAYDSTLRSRSTPHATAKLPRISRIDPRVSQGSWPRRIRRSSP